MTLTATPESPMDIDESWRKPPGPRSPTNDYTPASGLARYDLRIPLPLSQAIRASAVAEGRSLNQEITEALRFYLSVPPKARDQITAKIASLATHQETSP